MRIIFVISCLGPGGAQRVLSDMANYWAVKNNWEIEIITITGDEAPDFYPLHSAVARRRLGMAGDTQGLFQKFWRNAQKIWQLRREITALKPDVVISFIDVNNILTLLACRGLGKRVIVSERIDPAANPTVGHVWAVMRKWIYRQASAVVGQTERISQWLKLECNAKAVAIPNPLRDLPVPQGAREKLILSVGRLVPQKGHDLLIAAFSIAHKRFPDWRLVILGEGPQRGVLEALCNRHGIANFVEMPGLVADTEQWMARAGLVVQASRFEGFPNVVMEAMAMGAAVIATDCRSGPSDLISEGDNGRLVPVDAVEQLADVMMELMISPEERARLGHNAMQIRNRYRQEKIMLRWERLLVDPIIPRD